MNESNGTRRPVGRPRLGKIKVMLSIDPALIAATDKAARRQGLGRSAFVEGLLRAFLARKKSRISK